MVSIGIVSMSDRKKKEKEKEKRKKQWPSARATCGVRLIWRAMCVRYRRPAPMYQVDVVMRKSDLIASVSASGFPQHTAFPNKVVSPPHLLMPQSANPTLCHARTTQTEVVPLRVLKQAGTLGKRPGECRE